MGGHVAAFSVVRHGYDRTEVYRYVQQLEAGARHTAAERDYFQHQAAGLTGQLDAARAEIAELHRRLDQLAAQSAGSPAQQDDRAARAIAVATSQATEITERARTAAEHTWAGAEQAADTLRERTRELLASLEQQHQELRTEHQRSMESARAKAEELTTVAERRRREIDAAAEADRIRIDREFSQSMNTQREALRKEVETTRAASTEEANRRIREASEVADRRIAAATAEVDRLAALRDQVTAQLRQSQQLVDQVSAAIAPGDAELSFEDTLLFPPAIPVPDKPAKSARTANPARNA